MRRLPVAFYAPLKPPTHAIPSGDRFLARLFMQALEGAGFDVHLAARLRTWDGAGDVQRQLRLQQVATQLAERLLRHYAALPAARRPRLWFTYHLYHKAPDWIGPVVARALGIPYVVAEASYAPKQARGNWRLGWQSSIEALQRAELILNLNPIDDECLRLIVDPNRLHHLPPFLDLSAYRGALDPQTLKGAQTAKSAQRQAFAARYRLDPNRPWLICTAMMRADAKLLSYQLLAEAIDRLHAAHHLLVIGDGRARAEVEALFANHPQVRFLGALSPEQARPVLSACDLYVWPAINEAFGMALLEAQACGLGIVAGNEGGVPSIVDPNGSALVEPRDAAALINALEQLLNDQPKMTAMGQRAQAHVFGNHDLGAAAQRLQALLAPLIGTPGSDSD